MTRRARPLAGAVAAEWVRFRSVRSTWWGLAAALVLMVLVSAAGAVNTTSGMDRGSVPASEMALYGAVWAVQFVLVGTALTFVTSEYAHGSVRLSLQAVPSRWRWFTAKAIVVAVATFTASLGLAVVGTLTAHLVMAHPLMGGHGTLVPSEAVADVLRCAVFLTLLSLMGLGAGTALRSAAAALTAMFLLVLGLPVITLFSPNPWVSELSLRLPLTAGIALLDNAHVIGLERSLSWTGGLVVLMFWVAAALAVGALVLQRRDA